MVDNTFWSDFTIADAFGINAIKDTYKRAFAEWKDNYEMLTALVMVLNHKLWQHYEAGHKEFALVYNDLWDNAQTYAFENLKDEALAYFIEVID